jgi:hypothetical protein
MNNLKMHSYQPAPVATTTSLAQKGGRGYHHKRGCKCPLCKRRGGGDEDDDGDIETGNSTAETSDFADDDEYDDLVKAEKGEAGAFIKVGGSRRRRRSKKSKKGGKSRKTRRHSRKGKKHGRKSHKRH